MSTRTIFSSFRFGRVALILLGPIVLIALGCGGSGPPMGRVSGTVSLKGDPLSKGNITFVPSSPDSPYATSQIGPDGSYELMTAEYGRGAAVGEYQVAISGLSPEDIPDYIPPEPVEDSSPISVKYADVSTSGLTATVERGSNVVNFDLDE